MAEHTTKLVLKPRISAGILLYRFNPSRGATKAEQIEILLEHFGGPKFEGKDIECWSIPKGLIERSEEPFVTALREFAEETGTILAADTLNIPLGQEYSSTSKKNVIVWAVQCPVGYEPKEHFKSNTCNIEWPKGSGKMIRITETDRIEWFAVSETVRRVLPYQLSFFEKLVKALGV